MFGYMTELDTVDICGVREIEAEGGTHAQFGKTVQPLFSGVHYTQLFTSASNASVSNLHFLLDSIIRWLQDLANPVIKYNVQCINVRLMWIYMLNTIKSVLADVKDFALTKG